MEASTLHGYIRNRDQAQNASIYVDDWIGCKEECVKIMRIDCGCWREYAKFI